LLWANALALFLTARGEGTVGWLNPMWRESK
jgi:hypothetical protein